MLSSVGIDIYYHVCGTTGNRIVSLYYKKQCADEYSHECSQSNAGHSSHSDCCGTEREGEGIDKECFDFSKSMQLSYPYLQAVAQEKELEPDYTFTSYINLMTSYLVKESFADESYFKNFGKSPPINVSFNIIFFNFHSLSTDDGDIFIS